MNSRMRGNEYFYWNLLQEHRESWVIIRLDLVSLITPLPSYGFWSNSVPTKAIFKGHPTPPVTRDLEKNSQRTSGITGN